jgi:hypothetical protein
MYVCMMYLYLGTVQYEVRVLAVRLDLDLHCP